MARQRRAWDSLSPAYRERLSRGGITKRDYESGKNLAKARGHDKTPEHGLKEAQKNPKKYPEYIRKRAVPKPAAPAVPQSAVDQAYELNSWKDKAFDSIVRKLGGLYKFNIDTVEANVYGGITAESGPVRGMDLAECKWTARATRDQLRAHASPQYRGNPWFYH